MTSMFFDIDRQRDVSFVILPQKYDKRNVPLSSFYSVVVIPRLASSAAACSIAACASAASSAV